LARFNITAKAGPRTTFEGLPIPAAASLLVAYTMFCMDVWGEMRLVRLLVVMIIVTSGLMVSSVSYEPRPTSWRTARDRVKWVYIFIGVVAVIIDLSKTFFPLIFIYVLSGIVTEAYGLIYPKRSRAARGRSTPPPRGQTSLPSS
jgi:CDP-diacylglycerol--serine O-phosphatidyltransferase